MWIRLCKKDLETDLETNQIPIVYVVSCVCTNVSNYSPIKTNFIVH